MNKSFIKSKIIYKHNNLIKLEMKHIQHFINL